MYANTNQQQTPVVKKEPLPAGNLVVNQTIIRPIDRQVKDIEYWRHGHITAERVIYPNRVRLYDLYEDVKLDGHLIGIMGKRIAGVRNKKLHYYDKSGATVPDMDKLIESLKFRELLKEIILQKAWGLTGIEFIPGSKFDWKLINRKHIKPDTGIISIEQFGIEGYAYDDLPLVWVIGDAKDYGFLLECAPYALYKRGTMADWSQFSEIFGMPIRVVKYKANDLKTKIELKEVLDESGSALVLMIPEEAGFEIIDGKTTNADGSIYMNLKKACDDEMSVIVLGVTETTQSSKSSGYAQADVHAAQQFEITKEDIADLQGHLNDEKFIAILQSYGYPVVDGGMFKYEEERQSLSELKDRAAIDMQISNKVPIEDDYWYDTYGIPKPKNYAELRKKMDEQAIQDDQADPAFDQGEKPGKKPLKFKNSIGYNIRMAIADFFDQARED